MLWLYGTVDNVLVCSVCATATIKCDALTIYIVWHCKCDITPWLMLPLSCVYNHSLYTVVQAVHVVSQKRPHFIFLNNSVKINRFEYFVVNSIVNKFHVYDYESVHHNWKMSPLYLVKCTTYASAVIEVVFFPQQGEWFLYPVYTIQKLSNRLNNRFDNRLDNRLYRV